MRICVTCTHSLTMVTLYKGLFPFLLNNGCQVDIVVGDREYDVAGAPEFAGVRVHIIPMRRTPAAARDCLALVQWWWFLLWHRFDVIHVSTPKASLLASLAACMTFNGKVLFVYRRRIYELMTGRKKAFYIAVDRIIGACSRYVIPISAELGRQLRQDRIVAPEKLRMLGTGSSNGIDVDHFSPRETDDHASTDLRSQLGIPAGAPILLFLGRICLEKGVDDLPLIFSDVLRARPDTHLIVAGPDDERDPIRPETSAYFATEPHVHRLGFVKDARPHFAACRIFVFPSYFEGFGNVLLEAAAMARPSVGYDVPGVNEAIARDVSGRLVPKGDAQAMAAAVTKLLGEAEACTTLGLQGRQRVEAKFRREAVWAELMQLLRMTAASIPGQPLPARGSA